VTLTFQATVHKSGRQFVVPKHIRSELQFRKGDALDLKVRSLNGQLLFSGRKHLKSGPEVYGTDIPHTLTPGLKILVELSISQDEPAKGADAPKSQRRYWVVSPNVMNNAATVSDWRIASVKFNAAFMGWGPNEEEHKGIGAKFAHLIKPRDIILIARRFNYKPEVVGFGEVHGPFRMSLPGFVAPEKDQWHGSLRLLRPFFPRTEWPKKLKALAALGHTMALRELVPARSQAEQQVCEWLEQELHRPKRPFLSGDLSSKKSLSTELTQLPHDEGLDYKVTTRAQAKRAEKKEAELVQQYDQWLRDQQRTLHVAKYGKLRCDAYEAERQNLIEAKCSTKREYIRMAVGQLLDYSHLIAKDVGQPSLAILLPSRPLSDVEAWLKNQLEIYVIWRDGAAFLDNANGRFT
jgi:bifunctional DNA-binding transcriptional regulator/antitoxin component of YhaV-PrlF toxin-antitoxin module